MSKSEGKALASRLTQMRKERNERAKITATAKKEQQTILSSTLRPDVGGMNNFVSLDESYTADDEMELIIPGGGGGISQGKSKIKKKKKGNR
jgi:hypothetical protein